jgi:deoxyribodipyrimidine photo-lyase
MSTTIWWVRRDLRLTDNQALSAGLNHGEQILPVFILDERLLRSQYASKKRTAFLFGGLAELDRSLRERGSRLIIRAGDPLQELTRLRSEVGAAAIFAERDDSPFAVQRDAAIERALPLHLTDGVVVHSPETLLKENGEPYTVYTPFSRKWKSCAPPRRNDILSRPQRMTTPQQIASLPLPEQPVASSNLPLAPGEEEAKRRLSAFVNGFQSPVYSYGELRNRPDIESTSGLSPYLRFGMISTRLVVLAAFTAMENAPSPAARKSAETWLNELIWREFYVSILRHFPHVRRSAFRPEYDAVAWENDEAAFDAWRSGRTGYPIVDAAMRQLAAQGWLHNRLRMIVASFLVKDLLVDWRWGERWFMQQLVDGDPAANNGGWQWTAGVGTDAAPYFRVFNPVLQGKKFDPDGLYVRRWLPELANVPLSTLHEPWLMDAADQRRVRCVIGVDYPERIVDHDWARQRVLAAYQAVKSP